MKNTLSFLNALGDLCGGMLSPHPDGVGLSQPQGVGQLHLDLSAVEGPKHTHHLQQTVIQPVGRRGKDDAASHWLSPR